MTISVQTVITSALQDIGIVGAGQSPNTDDNATCLTALIALLNSYHNAGLFGSKMRDVTPASNSTYIPDENERVVNDGTVTVSLPTAFATDIVGPDYGAGYWGGSVTDTGQRPPFDLKVIEEVNTSTGVTKTNLYDSRTRTWTDINALTYSSVCPLASRDLNGLSAALALAVADKMGPTPGELTVVAARKFRAQLATNWTQGGKPQPKGCFD